MGGYYLYTCNNTKMTIPSSQIFARVSGRRNRETGRSFSKVYVRIRHQERALVTLLNNIVLNLWRLSLIALKWILDSTIVFRISYKIFVLQDFLKYETLEIEMIAYGNLFA